MAGSFRSFRGLFALLMTIQVTGCSHFGEDFFARNDKGEWYDLGYKLDLAWNQGGPPLKVLAESQDGDLRRRAIMRMTEPANAQDREHYLTVLAASAKSERDTICRIAAVQQLATYKDSQATQALADAYQIPANASDKNGIVQVAVVQALGQRKDPAAMDTLISALNPKNNEDLRAAAAVSLGKFPNYKAAEALLASLKQERNTAVRHEVHNSLVKITGRDLPREAQAWEQAFQQAAATGEPLAKEPNPLVKLVSWWGGD